MKVFLKFFFGDLHLFLVINSNSELFLNILVSLQLVFKVKDLSFQLQGVLHALFEVEVKLVDSSLKLFTQRFKLTLVVSDLLVQFKTQALNFLLHGGNLH